MLMVAITVVSILYLFALWIRRFTNLNKLVRASLKITFKKNKSVVKKRIYGDLMRLLKIMIVDALFLMITLSLFGQTNFGIAVAALVNILSSIILPLMIKPGYEEEDLFTNE